MAQLYTGEVMGVAMAFLPAPPEACRRSGTTFAIEIYDGVGSRVTCQVLRIERLELVNADDVLPSCCVLGGTFSGDGLTLRFAPGWLDAPLGSAESAVLQRGTPADYEQLRARVRDAAAARRARFETVAATPTGSVALDAGDRAVAVRVQRNPLRVTTQTLGAGRVQQFATSPDGAWIAEPGAIRLWSFEGSVVRSIERWWWYRSPSGPTIVPTVLQESPDGRTRLYWRWREWARLERDGAIPIELGPGTHAMSPDGRYVASYPDIGATVLETAEHYVDPNFGGNWVELRTTYAPTRLVLREVATGASAPLTGDMNYVRYWMPIAEDYGFRPPAPQWSPSGRFLLVEAWESVEHRVYDLETGTFRNLGRGGFAEWAPDRDELLIREGGVTRIVDPVTGSLRQYGDDPDEHRSTWRFDASGGLLIRSYQVANFVRHVVYSVQTGAQVSASDQAVPAAALTGQAWATAAFGPFEGCGDLLVRHPSLVGGQACIERVGSPSWAAGGSFLAVSHRDGPATTPGVPVRGWILDVAHERVTMFAGEALAWSPRWPISVVTVSGGLAVFDAESGEVVELRGAGGRPMWNATGDVFVLDGKAPRDLWELAEGSARSPTPP